MSDNNQASWERGDSPVIRHPGPTSIDELLRHLHPAPDDETERFVAAIYADRRETASIPPTE